MKASSGSIINLDTKGILSQNKLNQLLNDIERSLSEITSDIRTNSGKKSTQTVLKITDKNIANVAYGRVLGELSDFLHRSTLICLQERLISDLESIRGGSNVVPESSSIDSLYIGDKIESLTLLLDDIENWVG
jgi:tetrahydromethanopterin S-methyltransferase subunit B